MSPEQALGDKVDHRTDLYTLGIVLWESVAGRRLFGSPDLAGVLAAQLTQPVPLLRREGDDPTLPAEFDALVQKLTARAPEDRPDRAASVRDTLRRLGRTPVAQASPLRALLTRPRQLMLRAKVDVPHLLSRWHALPQPTRVRRLAWAVSGLATLVILMTLLSPRANAPVASDTHPSAPPTGGLTASLRSAAQSATSAAAKLVSPQHAPARPNRDEPELPAALTQAASTVVQSEVGRDRRLAADALLQHRPAAEVPSHLRTIAQFEQERSCAGRKALIAQMQEQADPRFIPTLNRLYKRKNGCGFLGLADCYDCIRPQLREALEQLR
jgi:serine/threonine protein kinase